MTSHEQEYRRLESLVDAAQDELVALRQRVKEREEICVNDARIELALRAELAALKAGQGEPVGVYEGLESVCIFDGKEPAIGTKFYTSAPTIPAAISQAHALCNDLGIAQGHIEDRLFEAIGKINENRGER